MVLLAKRWNESINPVGYWVSEKMDGYRAEWTGTHFKSRNGHTIKVPRWFTKDLPKIPLDGEIWAGRGSFEVVASVVQGSREDAWNSVVYAVFDAPKHNDLFEGRIQEARRVLERTKSRAFVIPFWICLSRKELDAKLDEVIRGGGEGLMLRQPRSRYKDERSDTLLKVKRWYDDEACVIEHVPSKEYPSMTGSLKVITRDGKIFKVAGLNVATMNNPPSIGTIITYKYQLLTKDGIPRPASFLRVRV